MDLFETELTAEDKADLAAGKVRVEELMSDGKWHNAEAIRKVAGTPEKAASEGLRRLRELRDDGYSIDKRRIGKSRLFEYKMS